MKISGLGLLATAIPFKSAIAQTNTNTEYLSVKPLENYNVNDEARWMWPVYPGEDLFNCWVEARKAFILSEVPASAFIGVTADAFYRLFVNGKMVHQGPARSFHHEWCVDSIDISPFLKEGKNIIGVLVHNPGIGSHRYVHQGWAGFLVSGEVNGINISSNDSWRMRLAPGYKRNLKLTTIQLGTFQEICDGRLGNYSWLNDSYDDSEWSSGSFWGNRLAGVEPWGTLKKRDVPLLDYPTKEINKIIFKGSWLASNYWEVADDIHACFMGENKTWKGSHQNTKHIKVRTQQENTVQAFCFDCNEIVLANIVLEIKGNKGGEYLDIFYTEDVESVGPIFHKNMKLAGRYICGKDGYYESFAPMGFRYVVIVVRGACKEFRFNPSIRLHRYPIDQKGTLTTEGNRLDDIYDICARAQRMCMLDTYMDCPSREQAMWWGDAMIHFQNSQRLQADDSLLRRGQRLMAKSQIENGLLYGVAPSKSHEAILPDFTLAWLEMFYSHWMYSGKSDLFHELKDYVAPALTYFENFSEETGLLETDNRYWTFLDWAEPFEKQKYSTLYNLQYLYTLQNLAILFKQISEIDLLERCNKNINKLTRAIKEQLWDNERSLPYFSINADGEKDPFISLRVLTICLKCDLFTDFHDIYIKDYLLPAISKPLPNLSGSPYEEAFSNYNALTPYYLYFVFTELGKKGYGNEVLSCVDKWWGNMLDRGLTTTEEIWGAIAGVDSLCHAWSAHPIVHFSDLLLGVRQAEPGWTKISYNPVFFGDSANGIVSTPKGEIVSSWIRKGDIIELSLELPEGVTAQIEVPSIDNEYIKDKWIARINFYDIKKK